MSISMFWMAPSSLPRVASGFRKRLSFEDFHLSWRYSRNLSRWEIWPLYLKENNYSLQLNVVGCVMLGKSNFLLKSLYSVLFLHTEVI